jgi:hypothetical protein
MVAGKLVRNSARKTQKEREEKERLPGAVIGAASDEKHAAPPLVN